jgi:UDP-N-acetylglucosamine:LPS N-acetylglucosamine transferase
VALEREKIFHRVIVPLEVFEELNDQYSAGTQVRAVNPIVQRLRMTVEQRERLRREIGEHFGVEFRHLAVTMLGGGVSADRSAQTAAVCALMAKRPDTLHLAVVWPTATIEPGTFNWPNTRVVKTHHASPLVAASDLYISAVGYNSFHEVIYNRVPTVFMAQMSAEQDDQHRRAMAAVARGLADIVAPTEMLSLRAKVIDFLDGGRSGELRDRLGGLDLPVPGNEEAARVVLELCNDD